MKIRKINILLAIALGASMVFVGCSKDDGGVTKRVGITEVPVVSTNHDPLPAPSSTHFIATVSFAGRATVSRSIKVTLFFAGATPPTKIDVQVRKNNLTSTATPSSPNTNVKTFKVDVSTLPYTFTVTAADIETLFGAPIVVNDAYDFGPSIYVGSSKFEAFPAPLTASIPVTGTGTGVSGMHGFGEFARVWFR